MADDWCGSNSPHPTHMVISEDPYLCRGVANSKLPRGVFYALAIVFLMCALGIMGFDGSFLAAGLFVAGSALCALIAETRF